MTAQYFHFTLGPVQGFVAQARRTRDFWAGSFLLSWLSAVAMRAVIEQKGEIIFPKVSADYLDWLESKGCGQPPQQGCIPNRFKGGLAKVSADFDPNLVTASIRQAWHELAERVWQQDLAPCSPHTREIWDRQVKQFWEISWALSDNESESNLLDRRKNWRSYLPPEESGVKCMMMDGWQELSGIATPNAKGLQAFWENLRRTGKHGIQTDLRENEYLCAIAFIKRRFSRCFAKLVAPMPGGWTVYGWPVDVAVPSVAYMAAGPWLAKILEHASLAELTNFHNEASQLTDQTYNENKTNLKCIKSVIDQQKDKLLFWKLKSLDGNVFFESVLDNKNIYPDQIQSKKVKQSLKALRQSVKDKNLEPVSPFYAILLMDGDSLGSHMSEMGKQENISKGLENFTKGVQAIVESHSGFLIYAGGDDVLALLPLEYALTCAKALRDHYLDSFKILPGAEIKTTLSGAIEYTHIRMPLGKVLSDAHDLLDDVAKEHTGRDAIAVRVWKPGGQHLEWTMPWEKAIDQSSGEVIIDRLGRDFQKDQQEAPFSNSFFFNIEERLAMLNDIDKDHMTDLIACEYLSSGVNRVAGDHKKITLAEARQRIRPLLEQCFKVRRQLQNGQESFIESHEFNSNALQLIRFLAQKGVERG